MLRRLLCTAAFVLVATTTACVVDPPVDDPSDPPAASIVAVAGTSTYVPYSAQTPSTPSPAAALAFNVYGSVGTVDDDTLLVGNYNEISRFGESSGTVQRIAGGGTYPDGLGNIVYPGAELPDGFGGPALDAFIGYPRSLTAGPGGVVYFSTELPTTSFLAAVRPDGTIELVAGGGTGGDGGPAVDAEIGSISSLTVGPDGDLYWNDTVGATPGVRHIDTQTGLIDTIPTPVSGVFDVTADGTIRTYATGYDPVTEESFPVLVHTSGATSTDVPLSGPCSTAIYPTVLEGALADGRKVLLTDGDSVECTIDLGTGTTTSRPVDDAWNDRLLVDPDLSTISRIAVGADGRRWFVAHVGAPDVALRPIQLMRWTTDG